MKSIPSSRYDPLSIAFHWLTAIAVLAAFILGPGGFGRMLRNGVDPGTHLDIVWHESLGILIFVLTALRLLWTAVRPAAPQVDMSARMHLASKAAHLGLWALLLITPITAFLTLGSEGAPLTLLGDAIIWLAGLHAAAAIFHHVRLKDSVLASMVPWIKSR